LQHGPECTPASVLHRFSHLRFSQLRRIHVTDEDRTVLGNEPGAKLMKGITPSICNLGMQGAGAILLTCALRYREPGLQVAIEAVSRYFLTVAGDDQIAAPSRNRAPMYAPSG